MKATPAPISKLKSSKLAFHESVMEPITVSKVYAAPPKGLNPEIISPPVKTPKKSDISTLFVVKAKTIATRGGKIANQP
jgi:hypothetical protein